MAAAASWQCSTQLRPLPRPLAAAAAHVRLAPPHRPCRPALLARCRLHRALLGQPPLARLLGLAHGIGPALDRQVIGGLRLRCWSPRLMTLRPTLPLATLVLAATITLRVLWAWLIVRRPLPLAR